MKKTLVGIVAFFCLYFSVNAQQEINDAITFHRGNGVSRGAADADIFQATLKVGANPNQFLVYIRPNIDIPVGSRFAGGAPQVSFSVLSPGATFVPVYAFVPAAPLSNSVEVVGGRSRMTVGVTGSTDLAPFLPWVANEERLAFTVNVVGGDTVGARLENDINAGVFIFYVADEPTFSNWTHYAVPFYSAGGNGTVGVDGIYQYVTINGTGSPLPVRFSAYNVTCTEKGALINWSTSDEQNSSRFEIEKNTSGTWTKIDEVAAAGNSSSTRTYQYLDLAGGQAQYRLKQVDLDFRSVYTDVKSVNCQSTKVKIALYPIPTRDNLTLAVQADRIIRTNFQVYDMSGKLVHQQTAVLNNGSTNITMNLARLATGEYMLVSTDKTIDLNRKFSIVR